MLSLTEKVPFSPKASSTGRLSPFSPVVVIAPHSREQKNHTRDGYHDRTECQDRNFIRHPLHRQINEKHDNTVAAEATTQKDLEPPKSTFSAPRPTSCGIPLSIGDISKPRDRRAVGTYHRCVRRLRNEQMLCCVQVDAYATSRCFPSRAGGHPTTADISKHPRFVETAPAG